MTVESAQTSFRLACKIAAGFVLLLWLVHLLNWSLGLHLEQYGVRPRQFAGLPGIFFAPLIHKDFAHLISNSLPLLVLGAGMLYLYPNAALTVIPVIYLGTGLIVWLLGRPSFHIGASGLIYGLAIYIFAAGLLRRDVRAIAAALLVYFLYGTLAWGVLPLKPGVSWETHLAAAIFGLLLAFIFRHLDRPPRKRYTWEDEEDDNRPDETDGRY